MSRESQAEVLVKRGKFRECWELLASKPQTPAEHRLLAQVHLLSDPEKCGLEAATERAVKLLQIAVKGGDARAAWILGDLYETSEFVGTNLRKASHYYEIAHAAGLEDASLRLAYLLRSNPKLDPAGARTLPILEKLIESKDPDIAGNALSLLGRIKLFGEFKQAKDVSYALECFQRGSDLEDATCLYWLALEYAKGMNLPRDRERAESLLTRAEAASSTNAQSVERVRELIRCETREDLLAAFMERGVRYEECVELIRDDPETPLEHGLLGKIYLLADLAEDGVRRDRKRAVKLLTIAAEAGHGESGYHLGDTYRNADGVKEDLAKAAHYYEIGWKNGFEACGSQLAEIWLDNQDLDPGGARCIPLLEEMSRDEESPTRMGYALLRLGRIFLKPEFGLERDAARGLAYLVRGAANPLGNCLRDLGMVLALGTMVPQDLDRAEAYLVKAVELDSIYKTWLDRVRGMRG